MPDIIKFNPTQPGELDRLASTSYLLPRVTNYQRLCFRIARRALDLPAPDWRGTFAREGMCLRHLDQLDPIPIQRWLLEASEVNELAAMVMLDAMDFFCDCLRFMTRSQDHDFLDARFKGDFTKSIGGLPFVFRIPAGWELSLFHDKFDEGNYSVGRVLRCHLSQSTTDENWGLGDLVGRGKADYTDLGFFGVPCEIVPKFKRTPIDADDERWRLGTVTATIPFQWIREVKRRDSGSTKERLEAVPSEEDILAVADRAMDAVREHFAEIARRVRRRMETSRRLAALKVKTQALRIRE